MVWAQFSGSFSVTDGCGYDYGVAQCVLLDPRSRRPTYQLMWPDSTPSPSTRLCRRRRVRSSSRTSWASWSLTFRLQDVISQAWFDGKVYEALFPVLEVRQIHKDVHLLQIVMFMAWTKMFFYDIAWWPNHVYEPWFAVQDALQPDFHNLAVFGEIDLAEVGKGDTSDGNLS